MNEKAGYLAGRTVIVTGGGSGIGRATARRAGREGAPVAVLDLHRDNAEETAEMVRDDGGTAGAYPCDVSDDASVAAAVGAANDELGRVSGVVTAAGIFHGPDLRLAHEVSVEDFMAVLQVNLIGTFAVVKHALPQLMEGGGAIVTIASTAAIRGHGQGAGYTASKGGVDALTPARGAVRAARRSRQLHLPGRRRHTDDRRNVRDAASPGTRDAPSRSGATPSPRTSPTSRCSSWATTRAT